MSPPCSLTISLDSHRPRPEPPPPCSFSGSICEYCLNTFVTFSAAIPVLISGNLTESHRARIYLYSVCLVLICDVQVFYNAIQLLVYTVVGDFVIGCCCCITQQKLFAAVAFCTVCLCVVCMDNGMRVYSMNPILVFCSVDCMRAREVHLTGCA